MAVAYSIVHIAAEWIIRASPRPPGLARKYVECDHRKAFCISSVVLVLPCFVGATNKVPNQFLHHFYSLDIDSDEYLEVRTFFRVLFECYLYLVPSR
jgi:hypothetical protein